MLSILIAATWLAGAEGATSAKAPSQYDPGRVVCKYDMEPGTRLKRRKTCFTMAQWDELQRNERLHLMRSQYNGAQ
ncbi:MAG TPA: hypothetical protein VHM92_04315 [Allosphingosinicella sp.]|nr:hypothetical protein [Allosphingosinicella sp.]